MKLFKRWSQWNIIFLRIPLVSKIEMLLKLFVSVSLNICSTSSFMIFELISLRTCSKPQNPALRFQISSPNCTIFWISPGCLTWCKTSHHPWFASVCSRRFSCQRTRWRWGVEKAHPKRFFIFGWVADTFQENQWL